MDPQSKENRLIEWLNTLIKMAQWEKNLPLYFACLFNEPDQYKKALQLIREASQNPAAPTVPGDAITNEEWQRLFQVTTSAPRLCELFARDLDPFEGASASEITLLAEISDLTTDPQTIFYSRNGTFHLVFDAVRQRSTLNAKELIVEGLNKFYTLLDAKQQVAEELYKLACTNHWYSVLASLKDVRDYASEESATAKATLDKWNEKFITELRPTQLKPKDLFRLPKRLVKLAWEQRALFEKALDSIPPDTRLTGHELRQQVANVSYLIFAEEAKVVLESIESDLQLLAMVARKYIRIRHFAKLDGLVYAWPRVASLAMANYANLEYVEDFFIERKQRPSETELEARDASELYELCENNPALIRFLRLRPYFKDIDENELRRYRPLAPVTISDPAQVASTAVPSPSAATVTTQAGPNVSAPARVCVLAINKTKPGDVAEKSNYEMKMRIPAGELWRGEVNFSVRKLLDQMLYAIGATSEESLTSVLKELFRVPNAEQMLVRAGTLLQRTIFGQTGLEAAFATAIESPPSVRLAIATDDEQLQYLPWEWLLRPHHAELLLSNSRFSVVRSPPTWSEAAVPPLSSPIRVLGLFPNSPVGARNLSEESTQALKTVTSAGARYQPLVGNDATLDRVKSELEKFLPDVVHFDGYVSFRGDPTSAASELAIGLSYEESSTPIDLSQFVSHLVANDVRLMVIGRNELGRVYGNTGPILSSRLTKMGVPAVLAPIRAVDDVTATAFTTEFYRAFFAGNSLEHALYIARRKVASRGGDWTAFALFANPSVLDFFQLLSATS